MLIIHLIRKISLNKFYVMSLAAAFFAAVSIIFVYFYVKEAEGPRYALLKEVHKDVRISKTLLTESQQDVGLSALLRLVDAVNSIRGLSATESDVSAPLIDEALTAVSSLPRPNQGDRKSARRMLDQGLVLLRRDGQAEKAADILLKAHHADPSDVQILNDLAYAELKAARFREAHKHLLESLLMAPKRSSAWANLAELAVSRPESDIKSIEEAAGYYVVAYWFSNNRNTTIKFLQAAASSGSAQTLGHSAANRALEIIEHIKSP